MWEVYLPFRTFAPEGRQALLSILNMVRILLISVLLAAPGRAARQPLHMWTDKDGITHVDDTPPPPRARTAPRKTAPAPAPTPKNWWEKRTDAPPDEIDRAAAYYNIPAELVRAVIWAESAGDSMAVSRAGAIGLMQLMPHTAGEMYVQDPIDPAQNIMGG